MFFNKALAAIFLATSAMAQSTITIVDVLKSSGNSTSLLNLLTSSPIYKPLVDALSGPGPFTLFAPNDNAFSSANTTGITDFTNILQYHVIPGVAVYSTNLTNGANFVNTLLTNTTLVKYNDSRGQVLDAVKGTSGINVFYGLSNASVVTADLAASNGVIHIIDEILIPPKSASETAFDGGFTKLVYALNATNLTDTVDKAKSITIFAPVNATFDAIPSNILTTNLSSVLIYHVVSDVYYSTNITSLKEAASVATLNGDKIKIEFINGTAFVNDKKIVQADILIDSGVVHIIDGVLLPLNNSIASANSTAIVSGSSSSGTTSSPTGSGASFQQASIAAFVACVFSLLLM